MKYIAAVILFFGLFVQTAKPQTPGLPADSIRVIFEEIKEATRLHTYLWGRNLYGPILFVDPVARWIYANEPDNVKSLTFKNGIYTGTLPREFGVSNTSVEWNGKRWAMIMLPLPENRYDRTDLIVHELFHSAQLSLEFDIPGTDNNHLNQREGRIYLRLELAALQEALKDRSFQKTQEHIQNALIFRKFRHLLYRGSELTENRLELLEGLPTYTGQIMSGRNRAQWKEYLIARLDNYTDATSFVRSFAYETVPVYGFFLSLRNDTWNRDITAETDFTEYFSEVFGLKKRIVLQSYVKQVAEEYNGPAIEAEEAVRGVENVKRVTDYQKVFFENPHLEIGLEKVDISFNPKDLIPLEEDEGTVYTSARISDNWGVLSVSGVGVLLGSGWRWAIVSEPEEIRGNVVKGVGWTLQLNEGYFLEKLTSGDYRISRKKP